MSKTNNGGPAFPSLYPRSDEDGRQGMSLRACLAGMAMQGFLCQQSNDKCRNAVVKMAQRRNSTEVQINAACAVEQADALIAELEKDI